MLLTCWTLYYKDIWCTKKDDSPYHILVGTQLENSQIHTGIRTLRTLNLVLFVVRYFVLLIYLRYGTLLSGLLNATCTASVKKKKRKKRKQPCCTKALSTPANALLQKSKQWLWGHFAIPEKPSSAANVPDSQFHLRFFFLKTLRQTPSPLISEKGINKSCNVANINEQNCNIQSGVQINLKIKKV